MQLEGGGCTCDVAQSVDISAVVTAHRHGTQRHTLRAPVILWWPVLNRCSIGSMTMRATVCAKVCDCSHLTPDQRRNRLLARPAEFQRIGSHSYMMRLGSPHTSKKPSEAVHLTPQAPTLGWTDRSVMMPSAYPHALVGLLVRRAHLAEKANEQASLLDG